VAQELKDKGFTKVYALKGGWKDWEKAGFPTEKK
jgi:rhodanese-related sulfurtransferase